MDFVLGSVILIFASAMALLVHAEFTEKRATSRPDPVLPEWNPRTRSTADADSRWAAEPVADVLDYVNH